MNKVKIEFNVNKALYGLLDDNDFNAIIKKAISGYSAEAGEVLGQIVAKNHFGEEFFKCGRNAAGYDIYNEDESILVEVKTASSLNGSSNQFLISSFKNKRNKATHFLIIDAYSTEIRLFMVPHDDFFDRLTFSRSDKDAITWNATYESGRNMNHEILLEFEII